MLPAVVVACDGGGGLSVDGAEHGPISRSNGQKMRTPNRAAPLAPPAVRVELLSVRLCEHSFKWDVSRLLNV